MITVSHTSESMINLTFCTWYVSDIILILPKNLVTKSCRQKSWLKKNSIQKMIFFPPLTHDTGPEHNVWVSFHPYLFFWFFFSSPSPLDSFRSLIPTVFPCPLLCLVESTVTECFHGCCVKSRDLDSSSPDVIDREQRHKAWVSHSAHTDPRLVIPAIVPSFAWSEGTAMVSGRPIIKPSASSISSGRVGGPRAASFISQGA